jgi:hypothetical protein
MDIRSSAPTYRKVDRFLLKLLIVELVYFILAGLLLVLGFAFAQVRLSNAILIYDSAPLAAAVLILPILMAGSANAIGGALGAVSYLKSGGEGYPGTGLLVSWISTVATSWFFLTLLFVLFWTLILNMVAPA